MSEGEGLPQQNVAADPADWQTRVEVQDIGEESQQRLHPIDRRLLHGAVLSKLEGQADVEDRAAASRAAVEPENNDDGCLSVERGRTYFTKRFNPSGVAAREELLKLLANSKKVGHVTFDLGLTGVSQDFYQAITLKQPIKPTSRLRTWWDTLVVIMICYGLVMIPFDIAFDVARYPWIVFDVSLDLLFIVDVGLNFLTAYMNEDNELIMDFRLIRNHYLRSWFIPDVLASIPFGTISYFVNQDSIVLQVVKLLKAFRLFRMAHLYRAMANLSVIKGPFLVAVLMVFYGIAAHWFGCIFWKIGVIQGGENSWIGKQGSFPNLINSDQGDQYFVAVYWAMVTITTLGYGDITPRTQLEVGYATAVIFAGAAMYATLISSVSMIVFSRFTAEAEYNRHMDMLQAFAKLYHLPPDVTRRVNAYYDFIWERRRDFSKMSIMDDLPLELRAVVAGSVHAKMMQHNVLLCSCESFGFKHMFAAKISGIILRLPDDVLHFEGEETNEIFFVRSGLVEVVIGLDTVEELVIGKRRGGGHCGDIGLFDLGYHSTSSVTVQFSEVCTIPAKSFLELLAQFPKEHALFQGVAKARAATIERLVSEFDEMATLQQQQHRQAVISTHLPGIYQQSAENTRADGTPQTSSQRARILSRLLAHRSSTNDIDFFWKYWDSSISAESDETLIERTVQMQTMLDNSQQGNTDAESQTHGATQNAFEHNVSKKPDAGYMRSPSKSLHVRRRSQTVSENTRFSPLTTSPVARNMEGFAESESRLFGGAGFNDLLIDESSKREQQLQQALAKFEEGLNLLRNLERHN